LQKELLLLRSHGITKENMSSIVGWFYEMQTLGFNYQITDFKLHRSFSIIQK
jgi:dTDP-4-amino-4,6-dideoxygalactose transaminase